MALVDGNTTATGYGKAPTPAPVPATIPTYGGVVDDSTAYNTVVNKTPPVMAAPIPVVKQTVPNIWDERYQTWRDPNNGLLAIGSDATGWDWVTEAEYAAMRAPSGFAGASGSVGPVSMPSVGIGTPGSPATAPGGNTIGDRQAMVPPDYFAALNGDYGVPEDATWFDYAGPETTDWRGGSARVSDQEAYYQLSHPYSWEDLNPWQFESKNWFGQIVDGSEVDGPNAYARFAKPSQPLGDVSYQNPLYQGGPSRPAISADDPLYPSESNYQNWLANWPYYTPETRAMLGQVQWQPNRVDVTATGGGGYAPWDNTVSANRLYDEPLVHELAHAYYKSDPVMSQPENRAAFVEGLQRLANETDPAYAWPAHLVRTYYLPAIERAIMTEGVDTSAIGGEEHGGLWSAVMGNIYQLPPYLWPYYQGMFDTARFSPEDTKFRTGSGYDVMPLAYGPSNLDAPVNKVPR